MEGRNNVNGDTIDSLDNDTICDNFFHAYLYDESFTVDANGIYLSYLGSNIGTICNTDRTNMLLIMATRLSYPKLSRKEKLPHNAEGV